MKQIRFGTCRFNYPSWKSLVYSGNSAESFLTQYARRFDTVEIDRWFWSLFHPRSVVLPYPRVVREYLESTPDDFTFSIKVPNSITLTHFYSRDAGGILEPNHHFLSPELFNEFLELLQPMRNKIETLVFQFEYLNRPKMESQQEFLRQLDSFFSRISMDVPAAVEVRNKQYFNPPYFDLLREHDLSHVVHAGILDAADHGDLRALWGKNRTPDSTAADGGRPPLYREEIRCIVGMVRSILGRNVFVSVYMNNHYQGSAPLTIEKLRAKLDQPW
ncbi:MAG: DUF72 domain-containing protein [Spirochaetota bacterium]|nr:DUF72 domain-containing protein [Spirochaetota bacterium]